MSREMEDRLRAAYQAKAEQVTDRQLARLRAERSSQLADLMSDDLPVVRRDSLPVSELSGRRRHSRWLAPAVAAAAVAAVAAVAFALSTTGSHRISPAPPASHVSSPTPSLSSSPVVISSTQHSPSNSPSVTVTGQLLTNGVQGTRSQIPWDQVGAGWTVALWTPTSKPDPNNQGGVVRDQVETLLLVDPLGGRYSITDLPAGKWTLADWSGDRHRALLQTGYPGPPITSELREVDLSTGELGPALPLGFPVQTASYTKPAGMAILVLSRVGVERIDLSGQLQHDYGENIPDIGTLLNPLYTPDGTELLFSNAQGVSLFGNDGHLIRQLPAPSGRFGCLPVRWQLPELLLAQCEVSDPSSSGATTGRELWLVPIDSSKATRVAGVAAAEGGITDAVSIDAGTFVQRSYWAPCQTDIGTMNGNSFVSLGLGSQLSGAHLSLQGATNSSLFLQAVHACGIDNSLVRYDPATGALTTLLGGSLNGGDVLGSVLYRQYDPTP